MKARLCAILALSVLGMGGCASSDGGVAGTGVAALITGNVSAVDTEAALVAESNASMSAHQDDPLLPFAVQVSIDEAPGLEGLTDSEGNFELEGDFHGDVTLRFENSEDGTELGSLPLQVPAGSTTTLSNIELRPRAAQGDRVHPAAIRQFNFFGRVVEVDCSAGQLRVDDNGPVSSRRFTVRIEDDTEVTLEDGQTLGCEDIQPGVEVVVAGLHLMGGAIAASEITVMPGGHPMPPMPGQEIPVRARGTVSAIDCERGIVELDERRGGESFRDRLQLSASTDIRCGVPSKPCGCEEIVMGDLADVRGTQRTRHTRVIDVDRINLRRD